MIVRSTPGWMRALMLCAGFIASAAALAADTPPAPVGYSVRSDGDDRLYRIDLPTGVATQLGATGFAKLEGLAMNAAKELFAVNPSTAIAQSQLVKCATDTGACAAIGPLGVVTIAGTNAGLAFTPSGQLFLAMNASIYVVNTTTGAAAFVGSNDTAISGLAATAPTSNCASGLFAVGGNSSAGALYCVNTTNGALTLLGRLTGSATDAGIDADVTTGLLWEITNPTDTNAPAQVFSYSPITLVQSAPVTVTLGGAAIGGFEGLAVLPSTVTTAPPTPPPPRVSPLADGVADVPTLSQWSLIFSALTVALVALAVMRNRRRTVRVSNHSNRR
jgi:hypothetical protein